MWFRGDSSQQWKLSQISDLGWLKRFWISHLYKIGWARGDADKDLLRIGAHDRILQGKIMIRPFSTVGMFHLPRRAAGQQLIILILAVDKAITN